MRIGKKLPRPEILAVSFPPSDKELLKFLRKKAAATDASISKVVRSACYELKNKEE